MVNLKDVSIPFGIKLKNIKKRPLKYVMYGINFIYDFDIYVNEDRIVKGVTQKANSIDQVRDMAMEDFIRGIKMFFSK